MCLLAPGPMSCIQWISASPVSSAEATKYGQQDPSPTVIGASSLLVRVWCSFGPETCCSFCPTASCPQPSSLEASAGLHSPVEPSRFHRPGSSILIHTQGKTSPRHWHVVQSQPYGEYASWVYIVILSGNGLTKTYIRWINAASEAATRLSHHSIELETSTKDLPTHYGAYQAVVFLWRVLF